MTSHSLPKVRSFSPALSSAVSYWVRHTVFSLTPEVACCAFTSAAYVSSAATSTA